LVAAGAQCSQSPMTAGEARGDMEDMVTLRRIARLVATYLSGPGSSRVVIGFRRSHLRLSATGSLQHSSRCAKLSPRQILSAISMAIENASVRVCKLARRLAHRQLDRLQPHD
jgi:hypothetical protein